MPFASTPVTKRYLINSVCVYLETTVHQWTICSLSYFLSLLSLWHRLLRLWRMKKNLLILQLSLNRSSRFCWIVRLIVSFLNSFKLFNFEESVAVETL